MIAESIFHLLYLRSRLHNKRNSYYFVHCIDDFFPSELDFSNFFHPEEDMWGGSEGLSIPLSGPGSCLSINSADKGG